MSDPLPSSFVKPWTEEKTLESFHLERPREELVSAIISNALYSPFLILSPLTFDCVINDCTEFARCFGDGVKGASLQAQISRHLTPNVKKMRNALAKGEDPASIPMGNLYGSYKKNDGEGQLEFLLSVARFPSVSLFTLSIRLIFEQRLSDLWAKMLL